MHSQKLQETPLQPWIIAEESGNIVSAHCNCMAGLGEACTHVGALLFAVEATVRLNEKTTVTQQKAYWVVPPKTTTSYLPVCEIDFRSAKKKKYDLDKSINECDVSICASPVPSKQTVRKVSSPELNLFYKELSNCGSRPALLSLIAPYSESYVPKSLSRNLPVPLTELFSLEATSMDFVTLLNHCETIYESLSVTQEEAATVEKETRCQASSKIWHDQRAGRITASRLKAACHTDPDQPSLSLIKSICYPHSVKFSTSATKWGCEHEKTALQEYEKFMIKTHDNFKVTAAGLVLHTSWPFLGASLDGFVTCDCCGDGCVEIKCPFCVKDKEIKNAAEKITFCMISDENGEISLSRDHAYYYQVQAQLNLSERDYCDFVVWTNKDLKMERIEPSAEFWENCVQKASSLFKKCVLLELIGKYYTRPTGIPSETKSDSFCYCKTVSIQDNMVQCYNAVCSFRMFHWECLKLKQKPKSKWYCPECRKLPEFKRSRKNPKL